MLIIPFASKFTFKPIPWVTIVLILINTFIFFFIQSNDSENYRRAIHVYSTSILPKLEIPTFVAFLEKEGRSDEANHIRQTPPDKLAKNVFPIMLQRESKFIYQLHHFKWIKPDNPEFEQWKKQRAKFETKLSQIFSEEYSFKPDNPEIIDMFTHMFLHGGFYHLLGNMVFLFLLGFVVERLIGHVFFAMVYIAGGLCAASTFALVATTENASLVGASGAISTLMGLYVVLFGWRKIPFFYSLGFYFDYIKAPALILLAAFLFKELFFHFTANDHVAYIAHFGGIVAGAILGFGLSRIMNIPVDDMLAELEFDTSSHIKPWQTEFDRAMSYVERLQFQKASTIFAKLHEHFPDEFLLLKEWYKVERNMPDRPDFHAVAKKVLSFKSRNQGVAKEIHEVYQDYIKLAKPRPELCLSLLPGLANIFIENGFLDAAENIIHLLIKQLGEKRDASPLVLALAKKLRQTNQNGKAVPYLKWIINYSDQPLLAKQAQALLDA